MTVPSSDHRWSSPEDDPDEVGAWCSRPGCFAWWPDEEPEPQTPCPQPNPSRET